MKKKTCLIIFLLFISIITPISTVQTNNDSRLLTLENVDNDVVDILIYNPSYGDYDGDGTEDDVRCYANVSFHEGINRKKFEMYIFLYLPNGDIYGYCVMVNTFRFDMTFEFVFYNHAYVSGDYTISLKLYLAQKGNYYSSCYVIFDPPTEEDPDAEPFLGVSLR